MKQAVIFDVDGVILNSEVFYQQRRKQFFQTKGITLSEEDNQAFIGSNPKAMMRHLFPNDPNMQEKMREEYLTFSKGLVYDTRELLNPDVNVVLPQLQAKGIRLAIASSGSPEGIHKMLVANDLLNYFELVVSGEMFEESKPNPQIYRYTIDQLGLKEEACLVVEDSTLGIRAAKAAGLEVLALVQRDYEVDQQLADARIQSLNDVLEYL
ncbi:HAD family hydrolase [Vagococcus xieshaowenii]|uniref:HAD family phosphatase n=1 Tax=Vagococcus xieshaowenii TaxID=2562451 RepID=A0AAJ5EF42_9ENTE|nr:HAD family phosphatase [Vagococcus xieshaowenii]QCA27943.1 HAD family phosphatase [Vagococcus xieshaowenii]TFZ40328.1 HAD family phosphatase [Vagococcus xieshaowenii]